MNRQAVRVRQVEPDDLDDLYRICLLTADNGQDATSLFCDPLLPGHVFAAPYAIFEPSLAFVATDADGLGGYVVGALDSLAFEDRLEREWWPGLRARYPEPDPRASDGLSYAERFTVNDIHHPMVTAPDLAAPFPSHLHINLLPRLQGRGLGRTLIETLLSSLREQGSRGLHLHVARANTRAVGFYARVGFTELPSDGARVFAMTL
jgi:ribosomal protein S18 acetylase RimI-like enzyme